jgi:hypothetical protein
MIKATLAHHVHNMIDATYKPTLALPVGDRFARFKIYGTARPHGRKLTVSPSFDKTFSKWASFTKLVP